MRNIFRKWEEGAFNHSKTFTNKKPPLGRFFIQQTEIKAYLEPLMPACNNNAPKPPILFSCGLAA